MIPRNELKKLGLALISIFIFSFLFNFVWESVQAVYLYKGHNINAQAYIPMMGYVSTMDAMIIFGMYFIMAVSWQNIFWLRQMDRGHALVVFLLGLIIAAVIEYRAVYIMKEWRYKPEMPTIFGIGISPLLQLSITGLVSFWLTKRILR